VRAGQRHRACAAILLAALLVLMVADGESRCSRLSTHWSVLRVVRGCGDSRSTTKRPGREVREVGSESASLRRSALAAGALSSGLVVFHSGPMSLVGWLLTGALTASWAYVYMRSMCAGQRLDRLQLVRVAARGALAMPVLVVAARSAGTGVWLVAGVAMAVWAVLVTPDGHVPVHVRDRVRAAQLGGIQLMRGR